MAAVGSTRPGKFSEEALLILVSLADGPKHGYAMLQDIQRIGRRRLGPGTLYGALARLEAAGLIVPLQGDDRRTPYRLTEAGARLLKGELADLRRIASVGAKRLATR